jgi:hypothetical protein
MKILIIVPFMFDSYFRSDFIQNLIKNSKEVTFIYFEKIDIEYSKFDNCRFISNDKFLENQNYFRKIKLNYKKQLLSLIRKISFHARSNINSTYKNKIKKKYNIFIKLLSMFFGKDLFLKEKKLRRLFYFLTNKNLKIKTFIEEKNYDQAFVITKIYDQTVEWLRVLKDNNTKTTQIIHSWDNLTSKAMFIVEPKKLLVWGNFDKQVAIKEHNISSDIISIIKPIIISTYMKLSSNKGMPFKHILFAGVSSSYVSNEWEYVKEFSKCLYKINKNLNLIYRPHPRAKKDRNLKFKGSLVELDSYKLIKYDETIYIDNFLQSHLESMQYLQAKCCCVVTFFSTVALEFILSGRPAINYNFEISEKTKIDKNFYKYAHISKLLNEPICFQANDLISFNNLLKNCIEENITFSDHLNSPLEICNLN